jgi:hypothetical protein
MATIEESKKPQVGGCLTAVLRSAPGEIRTPNLLVGVGTAECFSSCRIHLHRNGITSYGHLSLRVVSRRFVWVKCGYDLGFYPRSQAPERPEHSHDRRLMT